MSNKEVKAPNFFLLGAAKCGTTSLHDYLKGHPNIFMTEEKEPHFFDTDYNYELGFDWYLNSYFSGAEDFSVRGEASPSYFHRPETVIPRMTEQLNPNSLKFIILLRVPVERAWSHYLDKVRSRTEKEDFKTALSLEEERLEEHPEGWMGYFRDGLYSKELEKWFKGFSRDQFLILLTRELGNNAEEVMKKTFEFLSVSKSVEIDFDSKKNAYSEPKFPSFMRFLANRHFIKDFIKPFTTRRFRVKVRNWLRRINRKQAEKPKLSREMEEELRARYRPEVERLENLIDRNLSIWK